MVFYEVELSCEIELKPLEELGSPEMSSFEDVSPLVSAPYEERSC